MTSKIMSLKFDVKPNDFLKSLKMGSNGKFVYYTLAISYILSGNIFSADNIKSTGKLWKLDAFGERVVSISDSAGLELRGYQNTSMFLESLRIEQDKILQALLSTNMKNGIWTKRETLSFCDMGTTDCAGTMSNGDSGKKYNLRSTVSAQSLSPTPEPPLTCGKTANFTHYDHLEGVSRREHHPPLTDPRAELGLLRKRAGAPPGPDGDLEQWERALRHSQRERPKSLQLYNDIGNFWRMKGDASRAIECFRRSLSVSPDNAEVLLNLARVLFGLQYLDDAVLLARRSLEVQPPDQSAWLQHLTLGQILKEYGSYQEAELHLRQALQLKPRLLAAEEALRQLQATPGSRLQGCTAAIICLLVCGVLVFMLSSQDSEPASEDGWRGGGRGTRGRWRRSV